jgi:hypothetical protein
VLPVAWSALPVSGESIDLHHTTWITVVALPFIVVLAPETSALDVLAL